MEALIWEPVRHPNPLERRAILRHTNRFYNNLMVAAIYAHPVDIETERAVQIEFYLGALKACLRQHPFLSVVVKKDGKGEDVFTRASHVDLREHFRVVPHDDVIEDAHESDNDEELIIQDAIEQICNDGKLTFFDSTSTLPHWRLDVLQLRPDNQIKHNRAFVSFTYSHSIADGMSGMAFHKTFREAMRKRPAGSPDGENPIFATSKADLLMLAHLPVGPLYLLGPALGHYLPTFLTNLLGLKASATSSDEGTWTGPKTFLNAADFQVPVKTAVDVLSIDARLLDQVLRACRAHGTKLTAVLNQIIARSLTRHLLSHCAEFASKTNMISATPTNLRKPAGLAQDTIGVFSSASYTRHTINHEIDPAQPITVDEDLWVAARQASIETAKSASSLKNQPIGLLSWISDMEAWMVNQLGKPRDASWELSNLMAFESDTDIIEKMYFCQPAEAAGTPMIFNAVSVKGGDLVICCVSQVGAIGLDVVEGKETKEVQQDLVRKVLGDMRGYLKVVADEAG